MLPGINSLALEDLPIRLLKQLGLDRPMLNQLEEANRPLCVGLASSFQFDCTKGKKGDRSVPDAALASAIRFCSGCPVREQCSADGDRTAEEGLWGGVYRRWVHRGKRRVYESIDLLDVLTEVS
jgi:hypothetical protein